MNIEKRETVAEETNKSSSVVPPSIPDILEEELVIPRILPHTWEEYIQKPVKHCDHPNFALVSPQRFCEAVRLWEWHPTTENIPPNGGSMSFSEQNDTTSDEYTFVELPDPRLYSIDESDIISHILEQKLSRGN